MVTEKIGERERRNRPCREGEEREKRENGKPIGKNLREGHTWDFHSQLKAKKK